MRCLWTHEAFIFLSLSSLSNLVIDFEEQFFRQQISVPLWMFDNDWRHLPSALSQTSVIMQLSGREPTKENLILLKTSFTFFYETMWLKSSSLGSGHLKKKKKNRIDIAKLLLINIICQLYLHAPFMSGPLQHYMLLLIT